MSNRKQDRLKPNELPEKRLIETSKQSKSEHVLHEPQSHQVNPELQSQELRRAHTTLEASHAHYVELYDFAPIGYLTLTEDGIIVEINLFAVNLLADERNHVIDRNFSQFIADEYKKRWQRFFRSIMQRNNKRSCELVIQRNNGTQFHAQLECQRTKPEIHPPLLRIALIDVTGRKQAEEEQRTAAAAFEVQAGIIVMDAHKFILRVNWTFCQMTGYNADEVIGKDTTLLRSDDHQVDFCDNLWEIVSVVGYWQGEIWLKQKNGIAFPAWVTLTSIIGEDGDVAHYVASITDITVQKQTEKNLLDSHQCLLNQVTSTKQELIKTKEESAEVNTALNVLLKHREIDKTEAQILLSRELETTVLPILDKLKKACIGQFQSTHLIGIIEASLTNIVKAYGRSSNLALAYQKLTPIEKQVASMVRQGQSTKMIAVALNISPGTVSSHRKHIRKKLDLDGKNTNLSNYLASLVDENSP